MRWCGDVEECHASDASIIPGMSKFVLVAASLNEYTTW